MKHTNSSLAKARKSARKHYFAHAGIGFACLIVLFTPLYYLTPIKDIAAYWANLALLAAIYWLAALLARPLVTMADKKMSHKTKIVMAAVAIIVLIVTATGLVAVKDRYNLFTGIDGGCSMYHKEKNFDLWWAQNKWKYEDFNITKEQFRNFPASGGMYVAGRVVPIAPNDVRVGDVISYYDAYRNETIAHRVIKIWNENGTYKYLVWGDGNAAGEIVEQDNLKGTLLGNGILIPLFSINCVTD